MVKAKRASIYDQLEHRARVVRLHANQEAQRGNHARIGTGHILLALIRDERGAAGRALLRVGCDLLKARIEVANLYERASHLVVGRVPMSGCAKQALQFALEESRKRGGTSICTEHLLMGVLKNEEFVAHQVLDRLELSVVEVQAALFAEVLDHSVMLELNRLYTALLQVGLLVVDHALEAGDTEWARVEVRHLHNVPSLIGEENPQRHSYFWNEERPQYLDWLNAQGSESARSRMRTYYEPIWDQMAPLIAERVQVVDQR